LVLTREVVEGGLLRCNRISATDGQRRVAQWPCTAKRASRSLPVASQGLFSAQAQWMDTVSDAIGPGDLVLCVNAAPNHVTGRPVPLVAGETYRVVAVMEFACPCGRSDALLDVGVDFAWCQTRFRLLPKPRAETRTRRVSAPKEKDTVR
jgi:hypothetical protein